MPTNSATPASWPRATTAPSYVTRREQNDVMALSDGDGVSDEMRSVAENLLYVNGITIHEGMVYLATDTVVYRAPTKENGDFGPLNVLIADLPDAGQHPNRTLAVGPDGLLYITVGSTCNVCQDTNPENATLLHANLDGTERETSATGLRNTIGFAGTLRRASSTAWITAPTGGVSSPRPKS